LRYPTPRTIQAAIRGSSTLSLAPAPVLHPVFLKDRARVQRRFA
jgi:hypothetical protein